MALEEIQSGSPPQGRELSQLLKELQGLTFTLVAGAAADTNIAVAGLGTDDTIVKVIRFVGAGTDVTDVTDLTSEAAITSAGNIQLSDTATTGSKLLVIWFNKGAL